VLAGRAVSRMAPMKLIESHKRVAWSNAMSEIRSCQQIEVRDKPLGPCWEPTSSIIDILIKDTDMGTAIGKKIHVSESKAEVEIQEENKPWKTPS
jgi:hypothetical protein